MAEINLTLPGVGTWTDAAGIEDFSCIKADYSLQ